MVLCCSSCARVLALTAAVVGFATGSALTAATATDTARPLPASQHQLDLARIDSLWAAGVYDSARAAVAALWERAAASGDSALRLGLLLRDGSQRVSFGDMVGGEPRLREALELAEAWGDSTAICTALRWLGVAVGVRGQMADAVGHYQRLLELAGRLGDPSHQAWAHIGLAWEARQAGRLPEASDHYVQAANLFADIGEAEGAIWALNGRGMVLTDQGDYRQAATCYRRAGAQARRVGFGLMEAAALNNLGSLAYNLGDPSAAQQHFERARTLHESLGQHRDAIIPGTNVALCQIDLGRFREADSLLARCLDECEEYEYVDLEGMVLSRLGRSARAQRRFGESCSHYRRALGLGSNLPLEAQIDCLLGLAYSLADADSLESSLAVLESAVDRMAGVGYPELRLRLNLGLGQALLRADRHSEALQVLTTVARETAGQGFGTQRLAALVGSAVCCRSLEQPERALVLLQEAQRVWETERGLPLDPRWREQRGGLVRQLYTELGSILLQERSADRRDHVRKAFDALQIFKARTLQERMRGPGQGTKPHTPTDGTHPVQSAPAPITARALQDSILRPREILLDAYLGPDVSLLFAVTPDSLAAVQIPDEATLNRLLVPYCRLIASPAESFGDEDLRGIAALGRNVARLLLGDLENLVAESRRILLVPDGNLGLLPLATLPLDTDLVAESAPAPGALVEPRAYARIPAAGVLRHLRTRSHAVGDSVPPRLLAVGGGRAVDGRLLAGAVREAEELGRRYGPTDVLRLNEASTTLHTADLANYDLLHFAVHTRVDDQNPWQSAIELHPSAMSQGAGATSGALEDGVAEEPRMPTDLRASEIASLNLPVELVVLSSCGSATGRIISGEGVLGLSSAFLSAGAPAVVATLWPVDDAATVRFMESFYQALSEHEDVAAALARAQRRMRADPATAHPFFWAGFILVGDGDVRVPLEPLTVVSREVMYAVLALCGVLAAALLWRRRSV